MAEEAGRGGDVVVRQGPVCDWEAGPRPMPPAEGLLRWGRPAFKPVTTIACVRTTERVVGITYDDGPDPEHTPEVLDALRLHGARATFFVLVERAREHRALLRRIVTEGHEVGLHGIDHARLSTLPPQEALRRIRAGRQELSSLLGMPVRLYRPTYGAQSPGQLLGTRAMGLDIVLWSAWSRDWEDSSAREVADRALAALHPGAFLLMHDATGDPPSGPVPAGLPVVPTFSRGEATRLLLEGMADRGYTSSSVGDLLARTPAVRTMWMERPARGA